jgi:hypothetical protein
MSESLRDEITRRGWWAIEHHGYIRDFSGRPPCRDARVGGFLLRHYQISDNSRNYFLIFRRRKSTGRLYLEFNSVPNRGRNPDYDEWQRIVHALRRHMLLDDLANV